MIDEAVNPKDANFSIIVKGEDTKTTNSGMSTLWASGDDINLFHALTGTSTYVSDGKFVTTGSGASATFTGTVTGELSGNYDWYAIYPYSKFIADGTPANTDPGYITIGTTKTGIQTQSGNNSSAHICGKNYPAAGKVTNIPAAETPSITMKHLSSLLKVMVKNGTTEPIAVRQIQFTSDGEAIVGNYFVDFHGTNPSFTAVDEKTNTTAVLKVTDGEAIAAGSSAAFYLAIKPYTEADGNELKLKVSTYTAEQEKTKAADGDVVFAPGMYKTLNFTFTAVPSVATLPFSIDGTDGKAGYVGKDGLTVDNVTADDYTSNSPYLAKWSNNGAFIQLHYNTAAGKVSFSVRKSGGADNSTFHLTGSVDGITYHDIQDFVVSGAAYIERHFETSNSAIDPSYRYLRLTYEKGSNIGFGPFSVAAASSASEILSDDVVDIPAVGVTNAATTYTVGNISPDDVTVSAVDGTIVQSASVSTAGTVTYTVNPNYDFNNRVGTITLHSPSKGVSKVVNVNQLKSDLKVNNSTNTNITIYVPYSSTTTTFTVLSKEMGWSTTVTPATGMNLNISPNSHAADENAQTVTITSTTGATASEQTLGTIEVYRSSTDSQKRTITVKKGATPSGDYYDKVTTISEGTYLICNAALGKVITGVGSTLPSADVTISGTGRINGSSVIANYEFTITALSGEDTGFYTLKIGSKYIGYNSGTNFKNSETVEDNNYKWAISIDSGTGLATITCKAATNRYWGWNNSNGFKAYAISNIATYSPPTLYKKQ